MGKLLKLLVLVALFVAFGAPFLIGFFTQQAYENLVKDLNLRTNSYEISVDQYHRSWFQSLVTIRLLSIGPARNLASTRDREIIFQDTLRHGPLPFASDFNFHLAFLSGGGPVLTGKIIDPENIKLAYEVGIDTDLSLSLDIQEIGVAAAEASPYSILELNAKLNTDRNLEKFTANISAKRIGQKSSGLTRRLKDASLKATLRSGPNQTWLGETKLEVADYEESHAGVLFVQLENAVVLLDSKATGNLVDREVSIAFDAMSSQLGQFREGEIEFAIRNFTASSWQNITASLTRSFESTSNQEAAWQHFSGEMLGQLPALVLNLPSLEIAKLDVDTGKGRLNGRMDAWIVERRQTSMADVSENLAGILRIDGMLAIPIGYADQYDRARASAEEIVAEKGPMQQLAKQGVLVRNIDHMTVEIRFENGQLKLNGVPFDY